MYYTWAYVALILNITVCLYASIRGGPAEKSGAAIYLIGWLATTLVQKSEYTGIEWAKMAVDTIGFFAFVGLSLWARKIWTIFMAACQMDAVASHIAALLAPQFSYVTYITVIGFWGGYGLMICLAIGTYSHQREMRIKRANVIAPSEHSRQN